jgi:hypothetical protein
VRRDPIDSVGLGIVVGAKLLLHLATLPGYGYFRDELYYLACARHLAWGYVDHPPLSIALLWLQTALIGDSVAALHVLPALAGAGCVLLGGLLARELGGGAWAQRLTAVAVFASPFLLAVSHFYSMNVLEWGLWSALALVFARLLAGGSERGWLLFGGLAGLALLNKLQVALYGAGLVAGLLLSDQRRQLGRPWIWAGGALAFALFLPHVVWQVANGWPTADFVANARAEKIHAAPPFELFTGLVVLLHPLTAPLWLSGLAALLVWRPLAPFRPLAVAALVTSAVFAIQGAKVYYLAPALPPLLAAGAVAWERAAARRGWRLALPAAAAVLALGMVVTLPISVPVLAPERVVALQRALGVQEPRTERREHGELPTVLSDMFGWRELVDTLVEVWDGLPEDERRHAVILTANYGQAGAVDQLGAARGLPPAVSGHNSYWHWGPGPYRGGTLIAVGFSEEALKPRFDSVERVATTSCEWCMPAENGLPVFVCRGLRGRPEDSWDELRRFQ